MGKFGQKFLISGLLLLASLLAQGQTQISTTSIYIGNKSIPATDLVSSENEPLPVQILQDQRNRGHDISQYNPASSQLWTPAKAEIKVLPISENDEVQFDSLSSSRLGNFRFNGYVQTADGRQAIQFNLSRTVHDILLRDALLRKLGYRLDPIKYLKKVRVKFNSSLEAEDFILQLRTKTAGAKERFVVGGSEAEAVLVLQDVVAVPAQFENYSLAYGTIPAEIIAGRRVLNSLVIPYALVQMPESVNLFNWEVGSIFNNQVQLETESSDGMGQSTFSTSYEDAMWAVRRLARLTRQDFVEVVQFAQLPKEVAMLATEKIIARRNSLMKLFKYKVADLSVHPGISSGSVLKNGKIVKIYEDNWPGYSARFAFGDPSSPLNSSQMTLLARAQLQSAVIQNLVSEFNKRLLSGTDIGAKLSQKIQDRILNDIRSLITTGQTQSSTYALDAVPFGKYRFILNRDIVTGSYMGSDNIISAVDSIGANITLGAYFSVYGLPDGVTGNLTATASVTRTYSHITPVRSLELALKQPFKNMIVPSVRNQMAAHIESLNDLTLKDLETEEGKKAFQEGISKLKDNLAVGESFIITDSVGPSLGAGIGYGTKTTSGIDLTAYAAFTAQQYILSRIHILRSDENTIQVYRGVGNAIDLNLSFDLKLQASVLSLGLEHFRGFTKTKFFSVPLRATPEDRDSLSQIQALAQAFRWGSIEALENIQKPFVLKGDTASNSATANLLFYQWKWQSRNGIISVEAPTGQTRDYQKRVRGTRSGKNYQDFFLDVATAVVKAKLDKDISLTRIGGSNPGDTIGGSSYSRILDYEAQLDKYKSDSDVAIPRDEVLKINYRYKGWSADQKKIQKIIGEINEKAGQNLFSKLALRDTKVLRLYQIQLSFVIYERGIEQLQANVTRMQKMLQAARVNESTIQSLINQISKLRWSNKHNNFDDYSYAVMQVFSMLEQKLPIAKIGELVGKNNIFAYTTLTGFREGDEAGDQTFVSNTYGEIGSQNQLGPLTSLKRKIGITESELFTNWFLEAL